MDALVGRDNSPNSREGQALARPLHVLDDPLLMLDEVQMAFEVSEYAIYKAVKEGRLRRVRRPGYQPYYAFSDVVACFGEPKTPPPLDSVKNGESVKGGQSNIEQLNLPVAA